MPGLQTLQELISLLYSERKLLTWLFGEEADYDEESGDFWPMIHHDKSRLKRLIESGLLIRENGRIRLNYEISTWINHILEQEDFLDTERVDSAKNHLKRLIKYYQISKEIEEKAHYLRKVKTAIWALHDSLYKTLFEIESWLVLSLKEAGNKDLFEEKVQDELLALEKLEKGITTDHKWIEKDAFFQNMAEPEVAGAWLDYIGSFPALLKVISLLKKDALILLSNDKDSAQYINQTALLKKLSTRGWLSEKTNLEEVLSELPMTAFSAFQSQLGNPSPEQFSTEEQQTLARKFSNQASLSKDSFSYKEEISI
ncbi:MAG: hypothetical protein KDD63_22715, partial [Bacteroidetes bacterium]|nr:hypothetical protein [Bacteroidota bacterium]